MTNAVAKIVQDTIENAAPLLGKREYAGVISKSATPLIKALAQKYLKNKVGAPTRFTKTMGEEICSRVENGETLPSIAKSLDIDLRVMYGWLDKNENFLQDYNRSKKLMAKTLVENLVDEVSTLKNDQALAARVKSDLIKWVAARYNPDDFSDTKRLELKGEITHKHIHELPDHQKRKIAESWLMSQAEDSPGITAETTGPDLEAMGVREIQADDKGIIPKRKRTTAALPTPKGKRGRPRKQLDLDQPIDPQAE